MGSIVSGAIKRNRSAGFSLVELMVAMTVGLIVLAGILSLVVGNLQGYSELTKSGHKIENARFAMQMIRDDLAHAGYYGAWSGEPPVLAASGTCDASLTALERSMAFPVQGFQGVDSKGSAAISPWGCEFDMENRKSTSDVIVVNRSSTRVAAGQLQADRYYIQASPLEFVLLKGSAPKAEFYLQVEGGRDADIRALVKNVYFVTNCSDCASNDGIPTLRRLEIGDNGNLTSLPLVEGVEEMHVEYGLDENGNGSPERYVSAPSSLVEWRSVVAVRVSLLVRNVLSTAGHVDAGLYLLGEREFGPFDDGFKRSVYSVTVQLPNPAGRRGF